MRLPYVLVLAILAFCASPSAARSEGGAARLDFDVVFGDGAFGKSPTKLQWSDDGLRLAYVWNEELVILDPTTGEATTVLSAADLQPEATADAELDLDDYHWSPKGDSLLLERQGDLFLWNLAQRTLSPVTATDSEEEDPKFSPDGRRIAFVRDADLHLVDLRSGKEKALTKGGAEKRILNGKTDWVYWEELWNRDSTGFWWSPKGDKIAYYHFDESPVESYPLVDFTHQYPRVEWQKYPKAGGDNPIVTIGVLDVRSGKTTWMKTGQESDVYYPRVDWLPGGRRLAVQRMNRDQNRIDLLRCHPGTGECSSLLVEELATWVNVTDDLSFLADGSFLWSSEEGGWRRLYLHDADGRRVRQLSPEGWAVTQLDGFDPGSATAIFTAYSTESMGAARRQVFRLDVGGGAIQPLSGDKDWSGALVAPGTSRWVHSRSRADLPSEHFVRDAAGAELTRLPSAPAVGYEPADLTRWEFLEIPGPGGSRLPAAFLRPSDFDELAALPIPIFFISATSDFIISI